MRLDPDWGLLAFGISWVLLFAGAFCRSDDFAYLPGLALGAIVTVFAVDMITMYWPIGQN